MIKKTTNFAHPSWDIASIHPARSLLTELKTLWPTDFFLIRTLCARFPWACLSKTQNPNSVIGKGAVNGSPSAPGELQMADATEPKSESVDSSTENRPNTPARSQNSGFS
jgi:hypothetical protein